MYSLFLSRPVFQENKIYNFKIHVISFLNTKQTNDGIFFWTPLGIILIWQKFFGTWESDFKQQMGTNSMISDYVFFYENSFVF